MLFKSIVILFVLNFVAESFKVNDLIGFIHRKDVRLLSKLATLSYNYEATKSRYMEQLLDHFDKNNNVTWSQVNGWNEFGAFLALIQKKYIVLLMRNFFFSQKEIFRKRFSFYRHWTSVSNDCWRRRSQRRHNCLLILDWTCREICKQIIEN